MSLATLNGAGVTGGRLTLTVTGAATAELELQGEEPADGPAVLEVGGVALSGFADYYTDEGAQLRAAWTAGAAGLGTQVAPQHYRSPVTRRRVLVDALGLGGEVLSPTSDASILDVDLGQWTRAAGTVTDAVRRLLAGVAAWRMLPDGTVWVGAETWLPLDESAAVVESEEPTQRAFTVSVDALAILPGFSFRGERITAAEYTLDGAKLRARLTWGEAVSAARALVREELAGQVYTAPYAATVVGQNGDGTLELRSGDARIANMSRIPIRPGLPGLSACQVAVGTTAIVEFENGDPSRPVVTGWQMGSAQSLTLDAAVDIKLGALASAFAARADLVDANFQTLAASLASHAVAGNGAPLALVFSPQAVGATKVKVE